MKTSSIIAWVAVGVSILLAIVLYQTCNTPPVIDKGRLALIDSMTDAHNRAMDSLTMNVNMQDEIIKSLTIEKDAAQDKALKSAANASYWNDKYKQAREVHDTVTMIYSCDSLSWEFDEFKLNADITFKAADSIIYSQFKQIQLKDEMIGKQADHIKFQYTILTEQERQIKDLSAELGKTAKKERRKSFFGKVGAFIIGAGAGIVTGIILSK